MKFDKSKMMKLDLLDDILDTSSPAPAGSGIMEMALSQLQPFPEHKFKLYNGERLNDMVESIKEFGVLMPVILWHKDDDYYILSGHNRVNAAKLAGLQTVPVIVKESLTHEDAVLIVTETNLRQRSFSDLSESEKAYSLAQHYEAMKCQGKRSDLLEEIESLMSKTVSQVETRSLQANISTLSQVETRLRTDEKLGQQYGLSRANVARYIRISSLTPELLELLDSGKIAFLTAYTLSFITDITLQKEIYRAVNYGFKLDMKKAELLRQKFEAGLLDKAEIDNIFFDSAETKEFKQKAVKIKPELAQRYFAGKNQREINSIIEKALAQYFGGAV